jgi:SAM-dependent methyltransferase
MEPDEQRAYWNKRIAAWDSSTYGRTRALPWIERVAGLFRANLRARQAHALDALRQAAPSRVLELGCGTGELFFGLQPRSSLERYVGVDISSVAIEQALARPTGAGIVPQFVCSSLQDLDPTLFADFDFVLALGLWPYLTDPEVSILAGLIRGKRFLLDYHLAGGTLWNLMHAYYRSVAKHPFYRMHSDRGISQLLRANGVDAFSIVHHRGIAFVQHLGDER